MWQFFGLFIIYWSSQWWGGRFEFRTKFHKNSFNMKLATPVCWCSVTFYEYNKVLLQWSLSEVYCISIATKCGGLLHFYRNPPQCKWHSITRQCIALHFTAICCCTSPTIDRWKKKLAGAVLSNFRSQYFRYLAAKCDLNTPALCFGWAQIYTHPLQHLFKNWLKADSDCPLCFCPFSHFPKNWSTSVLSQ